MYCKIWGKIIGYIITFIRDRKKLPIGLYLAQRIQNHKNKMFVAHNLGSLEHVKVQREKCPIFVVVIASYHSVLLCDTDCNSLLS